VVYFLQWRIIPTDIPNIGICEHETSVTAASSCPCNDKHSIMMAKRLEQEEYLMKWHIIYQTFRWVIGLLASRKFADVKDGNNQKLRMHVFVDNINDSLLKTVFSVVQPAVAICRVLQLPDWRCRLIVALVRLADAILLFQVAQKGIGAVDVFSEWIFINFRHLVVGFDVSREVVIRNDLPLGCTTSM
jgi:hypothetical protein